MELKKIFILKLSRKEAEALKILLGEYSDNMKRSLGLDEQDIKKTSKIYNKLPDREDAD